METWSDSRINEKKEILAFSLTSLVHGEEEAKKAQNAAHALFSGEGDDSTMPTTELSDADLKDGSINVLDLLVVTKLCASKSEARRLVQQGGVSIDNEKVADPNLLIAKDKLQAGIKIKKGKKIFHKVVLK